MAWDRVAELAIYLALVLIALGVLRYIVKTIQARENVKHLEVDIEERDEYAEELEKWDGIGGSDAGLLSGMRRRRKKR